MKRSIASAVLSALLCSTVLAGCQGHTTGPAPASGVPAAASTPTDAPENAGTPVPGSGAGVDSDSAVVDQQLAGLDSELAKATQGTPDGD